VESLTRNDGTITRDCRPSIIDADSSGVHDADSLLRQRYIGLRATTTDTFRKNANTLRSIKNVANNRAGSWSLRALRLESDCGPLVHIFAILTLLWSPYEIEQTIIGSQTSDHYFRSVCWFVCLFVCLCRVFSQPSLIRFRSN